MIEELNQIAASSARDAIEGVIRRLEGELLKDPAKGKHAAYFDKMDDERKAAIGQLYKLRAVLNRRAFDAYAGIASGPYGSTT